MIFLHMYAYYIDFSNFFKFMLYVVVPDI